MTITSTGLSGIASKPRRSQLISLPIQSSLHQQRGPGRRRQRFTHATNEGPIYQLVSGRFHSKSLAIILLTHAAVLFLIQKCRHISSHHQHLQPVGQITTYVGSYPRRGARSLGASCIGAREHFKSSERRKGRLYLLEPHASVRHWSKTILSSLISERRLTSVITKSQIYRTGVAQHFAGDITRALDGITERLRQLARLEQIRRAEAAAKRTATDSGPFASGSDAKRVKLDPDAVAGSSGGTSAARAALVGFDWRSMERDVVTDLIVANLQHFNEEAVLAAISVSIFLNCLS